MSEIQESYALLMQIDKLLADIELKITNIEQQRPRLESTLITFRQLERIALRYATLARRLTGSEDAEQVIATLSRILIVMRMLEMSGTMIASGITTGGLLGAVMAGAGIAGVGMAQLSIMEGY